MEQISVKKTYKLVDEWLFEQMPELEPLDCVCIDIHNQPNPVYTFVCRLSEDISSGMSLRNSEIKSINGEVIRYNNNPGDLAQLAYKDSKNKVYGDKLYSLLERYLIEVGL